MPSSERRCTRGGRCFGPALCGMMRCLRLSGPLACTRRLGTRCRRSAVTMKTILDEDARKAVGAWVARLTGQEFVLAVLAKNCDCQTDPRPSLHGGTLCDSICVALSCSGGEFSPDGLDGYSWASVTPTAQKYTTNFSQYKCDVGCVCIFADVFFPGEVSFRHLALTGNGPRQHTLW